jgi:DNA-binding NarL/FixJ family response regulator
MFEYKQELPMKLNIIEDNPDTMNFLIQLFESSSEFEINEYFSSVENARAKFSIYTPLWLIDLGLPGDSGIVALKQIKSNHPNTKICMFTSIENPEAIIESIRNGANGYLLKNISPELLVHELKTIVLGGSPLTQRVAEAILEEYEKIKIIKISDHNAELTSRQKEILVFLSLGYTYQQISNELKIATRTTRKHIENIYKNLEVNSKIQAIKKGRDLGLLEY